MRLIDAEKLHCEVKEHCKKLIDKGAKDVDVVDIAAEIGASLQDAQTVDAVPVVRCRECKHCRNLPNGLCYLYTEPCDNARGYKGEAVCVEPDDYCSYGERRH